MLDVIEMMLKAHSDVSIKNANGFTCLHIAAKEGLLEMCKRLVEYGLKPDARDKYGFSCSYWAK